MVKNKKYFYVYYSYEPWGRGYIGKRECWCLPEEDVKYFGSFRDKTFKPTEKIILEVFKTRKEAMQAELHLQEFYQVDKNPHFANIYIHRSENFCNNGSDLIRKKISLALTGIKRSEETKRKVSEAKKGTIVSEETRKKLSEQRKGKKPSLGLKRSKECIEKQRQRMLKNNPFKGKKHSEESKKLMSERAKGRIAPNKGKPHSEETKRKISEKRKQQSALKKLQQQSGGN